MKKIAVLLAVLGLSASSVSPGATFNTKAVVYVDCGVSVASAVKVGEDKYITAAHVVDHLPCYVNGVKIQDVEAFPESDFATFRGPKSEIKAKTSCRKFVAGEEYLALGYANGAPWLTPEPWIASKFQFGDQQAFSGEAIPGMSGGAVIDDNGKVLGIINQRWPARSLSLRDTNICRK